MSSGRAAQKDVGVFVVCGGCGWGRKAIGWPLVCPRCDALAYPLEATIPDGFTWSWESQASQFPDKGPAGITYFRGEIPVLGPDAYVDCLVFRDRVKRVRGILYHYNETTDPAHLPDSLEKPGNVNIWVQPGFHGRGIAMDLCAVGWWLWGPFPWHQFDFTPKGKALAEAFIRKLATP